MGGEDERGEKAGWLAEAMYKNVMASFDEFGRMAARLYLAALGEGLDPDEAKDVVEATLTAVFRAAREGAAEK